MPEPFGVQSAGYQMIDYVNDVAIWLMLQAFKTACISYAYTAIARRTLIVHILLLHLHPQSCFPFCYDDFPAVARLGLAHADDPR